MAAMTAEAKTTDPRTKLVAAGMLLDRAWGKPKETLVTEAPERASVA
jgi:hypothetical protein